MSTIHPSITPAKSPPEDKFPTASLDNISEQADTASLPWESESSESRPTGTASTLPLPSTPATSEALRLGPDGWPIAIKGANMGELRTILGLRGRTIIGIRDRETGTLSIHFGDAPRANENEMDGGDVFFSTSVDRLRREPEQQGYTDKDDPGDDEPPPLVPVSPSPEVRNAALPEAVDGVKVGS